MVAERSAGAIGVGMLGAGVVGARVAQVILERSRNDGARVELTRILVRDGAKKRVGIPNDLITTDPEEVLGDPRASVIVEAIGGEEPARTYIASALTAGKHVVTANKEALAKHGDELFEVARENGVSIAYEASVGGGIPVLAVLTDSLKANRISGIRAIINGTTNYVLSSMEDSGASFADALAEAQQLGYAEADPTADVDAHDAVYKLAILARLGFGASVPPEKIHREGITNVDGKDLRYARDLGFTIKLLALAQRDGLRLLCRVHPALVPLDVPMAKVNGVLNAVELNGDLIDSLWLQGRGAGAGPTASAVMGDVLRLTRSIEAGHGGVNVPRDTSSEQVAPQAASMDDLRVRYYLRLAVLDRAGVLSKIAGVFGDAGISIASVLQKDSDDSRGIADLVIMTHPSREADMQHAAQRLRKLDVVAALENLIRVEDYDSPNGG